MKNNNYDAMLFRCTVWGSETTTNPRFYTPIDCGKYIVATDGILCIRVSSDKIEPQFAYNTDDKKLLDKIETIFTTPKYIYSYKVDINSLKEALKKRDDRYVEIYNSIPKKVCEECLGTGKVTYWYKTYPKTDTCPVCNGTGVEKDNNSNPEMDVIIKKTSPFIKIRDSYFNAIEIRKIIIAMEQIDAEEITFTGSKCGVFFTNYFKLNDDVIGCISECSIGVRDEFIEVENIKDI